MLNLSCFSSASLRLIGIAFGFAYSATLSLIAAETALTCATRRTYGSQSRHLCNFSAASRASRCTRMSIQRHPPLLPPVNSADVWHKWQLLNHLYQPTLLTSPGMTTIMVTFAFVAQWIERPRPKWRVLRSSRSKGITKRAVQARFCLPEYFVKN